VDVHAHLTDLKFKNIEHTIHQKCEDTNVDFVILNGLDPVSNRQVMDLSEKYPRFLPALGIYPLDAACHVIGEYWAGIEFPPPDKFDIDAELSYIEDMAAAKRLVAIGECGLDRHYVRAAPVMFEQERVLRCLMRIAKENDLPIILHSRKAEARVFEMLQEEGVVKAVFHSFMGKVKLGKRISEAGYSLSIPPAIARGQSSFTHLASAVALRSLLTETDSPYMGVERGSTNDPSQVPVVIQHIARIKGLAEDEVAKQIRDNCAELFRI
jgi:TatD DNase family protein